MPSVRLARERGESFPPAVASVQLAFAGPGRQSRPGRGSRPGGAPVANAILAPRERPAVGELMEPVDVLRGFMWVWQFGLYPLDEQRTRFVTRGSEHVPNTPLWWLGMRIMEPASFIMTRRFLLGVKERAEALRASAGPSTAAPRTAPTAEGGATR